MPETVEKLKVHLARIRRDPSEFIRFVIEDWVAIREGRLAPIDSIVFKEFLPGIGGISQS